MLCAFAMSSCSKNEVTEISTSNDNPNTIGLNVGTMVSKAETTTNSLVTSEEIDLYYFDSSEEAASSEINFTYASEAWSSTTKWDAITLSSYFYSMHDGSDPVAVTAGNGSATANEEITADGDTDLVYFGTKLAVQPTNSTITANFKHALSKLTIKGSSENYKLFITKVDFVFLYVAGTPTISVTDEAVSSINWDFGDNIPDGYSYFDNATGVESIIESSDAIGITNSRGDIFILPQTTKATGTYEGENYEIKSCIDVVFRAEDADGNDVLGYEAASTWASLYTEDLDNIADVDADDVLYIKARFTFDNVVTFDAATYYSINLDFDGGDYVYFIPGYCDEDGEIIDFTKDDLGKIPGQPEGGTPVNPDADTPIALSLSVLEWSTAVESTTTLY
ncbi:MAG: fimbrillin family protein [Rikenellaceae bacterium]